MAKDYSHFQTALDAAHAAAVEACTKAQDYPDRLDCGFAWVVVLDRSFAGWCSRQRAKLVKEAEGYGRGSASFSAGMRSANRYGDKHHAAGWCFWKPGAFVGQSVSGHEAGAKAFRDSLAQSLGIYVEMGSRLD